MPIYDYVCRNEECPSVIREEPCRDEIIRKSSEKDNFPTCWECGEEMPRAYLEMCDVLWKGIHPSGQGMKTFNMGPTERAVRRHNGWNNGVQQFKPIYGGKGSCGRGQKQRRSFTERPTEASTEGIDPGRRTGSSSTDGRGVKRDSNTGEGLAQEASEDRQGESS